MKRTVAVLFTVIASILLAPRTGNSQTTISLRFDTLPSAQGWTYFQGGLAAEASVFSVTGTSLIQNTMGKTDGIGNPNYAQFNVVNETQPFLLSIRARIIASEGAGASCGFRFTARTAVPHYEYTICLTQTHIYDPLGRNVPFDNTNFHDYVLSATPGGDFRLLVDGELRFDGPFSATGGALNGIQLGDGGALEGNAHAEITRFTFSQGPQLTIDSPSDGAHPQSKFVALAGSGASGHTLDVLVNGSPVGQVEVDAEGKWEALPFVSRFGASVTIQVQDRLTFDSSNLINIYPRPRADGHSGPVTPFGEFLPLRRADILVDADRTSKQVRLYGPNYTHTGLYLGGDADGTPWLAEAVTAGDAGEWGEVRSLPLEESLVWTGLRVAAFRPVCRSLGRHVTPSSRGPSMSLSKAYPTGTYETTL